MVSTYLINLQSGVDSMNNFSCLQKLRLAYQPKLPKILQQIQSLKVVPGKSREKTIGILDEPPFGVSIDRSFPKIGEQNPYVTFILDKNVKHHPKRVGVVLSGGQAAGGHNVITGLYDALKKLHPDSLLFGFCDGPKGILENKYIPLTEELLAQYRNQGGFDLIGSGRTKIETSEQFLAAETTVRALQLDGLVIIGGDDSNTNAALLAEYFLEKGCKTVVVGVPKTIDGDLANADIAISFGFDSAVKTYCETIGNIMRDALSAKKYYYFIKLMGRSASHITLECALQTGANIALIGEEVAAQHKTFSAIVNEVSEIICERSKKGKDYGVILIPEGIIEFIPEFKQLINELNHLLVADQPHLDKLEKMKSKEEKTLYISKFLSRESSQCFSSLPLEAQMQLLSDRDPHGNVQVSGIETERLLMEAVRRELEKREAEGRYSGKYSGMPHFCGYEGRSCFPSNFDAQYCYALGHVAALLVDSNQTGYICCVQGLNTPAENWEIGGRNLVTMMAIEERKGKEKPVIKKALVDLEGKAFAKYKQIRKKLAEDDLYVNPGPIQFFGPEELTDSIPIIIKLLA